MENIKTTVQVEIEGDVVRITRPNSSHNDRAAILGTVQERGWEKVYLDRRIHQPFYTDAHNVWRFDGAFTTILCRPLTGCQEEQNAQN